MSNPPDLTTLGSLLAQLVMARLEPLPERWWSTQSSARDVLLEWVKIAFFLGRRWFENFTATDNQALTPANFTQYCGTAPVRSMIGMPRSRAR